MNRRRLRRFAAAVGAWALVAAPVSLATFTHSSMTTAVAGHQAVVTPTFDGYATLDLGPYVPNLRYPSGHALGAHIDLGKTTLTSYGGLISRYAAIGAQPQGEISKVTGSLRDMALRSLAVGGLTGLAAPGLWMLLGSRRRAELYAKATRPRVAVAGLCSVALVVAALQPWGSPDPREQDSVWHPLADELSGVPIPERAQPLEVEAGLFTTGTRRLAESMLDSYSRGVAFYDELVAAVPDIADQLRTPEPGETVAILVSDRHDNVGMDPVARAIADAAGATVLLDAGDDTSTGSAWEAFSLDSLDRVFDDLDYRFSVVGNHDEGPFVGQYAEKLGFTRLDQELVEGPDGIRFFGADDPRSSGLGSWRDETDLSFDEHAAHVADQLCEYDDRGDRVATLLVHDANTGREALQRGCVDLVVGGHVHEQLGPTEFRSGDGTIGYSYTNGTTGGAAYAVAIGSKLRRNAEVTLITYRDGRPVGIQPVRIRTVGDFRVAPYIRLDPPPGDPADEAGPEEVLPTDPDGSQQPTSPIASPSR